ncbi:dihydrofolate reductase [Deinococcus reticulitermitis]|uniref:Dihydrofolate reductase n=2 Tax=Deinococcus reticulitermitis TaxID=856736 RepID=A0A1H6YVK4_9DEIO|nr:dihydrofolate reductase [Deinococcus reticulitermitis]
MSMPEPSRRPALFAVVAHTAKGRVIGQAGAMPWHLPADLRHFRALTLGHPCVMGRKVWDSLGGRALPDRLNIVLTRNPAFRAPGAVVAHSPEAALRAAGDAPEVAIIGGEEIYRLYLPELDRIERTLIHAELEGDTFFPEVGGAWGVVAERERPADEKNRFALTFQTLRRRG